MAEQTPRRPMDQWDDPELASLFRDEPDLYDLSRNLRASRPEPVVGTHFEPYLRARLIDAAARELKPRGLSRWLRPRPGLFAGGGAALGVAMIAAVVVATVMYQPHDTRVDLRGTNVAENHDVSPDQVIRVSFTQDVDHAAVEHNLQIHPATAVVTRWEGTTLVITPLHRLAANTPYTVTIPRTAVRTASGATASNDIRIAFGTKATPSPGPTQVPAPPPSLQPVVLGPVTAGSGVVLAPDGSVVVTGGLLTPAPAASPSPLASASLPAQLSSPGAGLGSPLPSPTAAPTPSPVPGLARLTPAGPTQLGPAAAVAAFSPSGGALAYLVPHGNQADLWVARADGSRAVRLARNVDAGSPLAWAGDGSLVDVSGGEVTVVDLEGRARPVSGTVRVAPGQDVALAPGGQVVYVGPAPASASPSPSATPSPSASASAGPQPSSDGTLVELTGGSAETLHGIRGLPAFSADGSRVAWVDGSGATPLLQVSATSGAAGNPTTVATAAQAGDALGGLALSGDGSRVVYTLTHGGGTAVRVVSVASGETVAVGDGQPVLSPVLSEAGDRIAFLRPGAAGTVAAEATVPGATSSSAAADAVPAAAASLLDRFVAAQLDDDRGTLQALSNGSLDLPSLTPQNLQRSYTVKSALAPDTGEVTAQVRLVRDASSSSPAEFADETLVADRGADGGYLVTSAVISGMQSEPNGPQLVHVTSERQGGSLVVRLSFDSDLDPATVNTSSITLTDAKGNALTAQVSYEVETRTAVVHLDSVPAGALTLAVSSALQDIDGQALTSPYSTTLQG
ncbi:MAG TPA: Ig-like domain-containing protein [Candidatus Dormibacteraeota bacterium]|nr:Ig-like domain-containing protein [Candidatus Dormibacteraeota bacterium]